MDLSGTAGIQALRADWLTTDSTIDWSSAIQGGTAPVGTVRFGNTLLYRDDWVFHNPWTYPVYISSPSRPIKLTLREVDRLRQAAQTDAALKAILEKFTPQIEVAISFE